MNAIKENFTYKLTFIGGREALIEGHKGISQYGNNRIEIRIRGGLLVVSGEELFIREINDQEVYVKGDIREIKVEKSGIKG